VFACLVDFCMLSVFLSIAASNPFASPFLLLLSSNTGCLHLDHLQWQDDSLIVYFAHQKNDQQGKGQHFVGTCSATLSTSMCVLYFVFPCGSRRTKR
jgi:hypothetical protein